MLVSTRIAIVVSALLLSSATQASAHERCGRASFYWEGSHNANGSRFKPDGLSVAHRSLPFGTILDIFIGHRKVRAPVLDRGPFIPGRILDLSRGAARQLGIMQRGVAPVCFTTVGKTHGKHYNHHRAKVAYARKGRTWHKRSSRRR